MLLAPEQVLAPDEIALAVLRLCDGRRSLAQIAEELAVQRPHDHQLNSEALSFFSLRRSLTMRPSDNDTTRSAMPATAAL